MPPASLSRLLLLPLLLSTGSVNAASGIGSITLPGVQAQNLTALPTSTLTRFIGALVHARNTLTGLPDDTYDPQPCQKELFYGELSSGQAAYRSIGSNLLKLGWKPLKEVARSTEVAFQRTRNNTTMLGLWVNAPTQGRSALILCEQALEWKPTGPLKTPPPHAAFRNTVTFKVPDWTQGAQVITPILKLTGTSAPAGKITPSGVVEVPLNVPKNEQLQPITRWKAAFDLLPCGDDTPARGSLQISDPHVRFTSISKLQVGKTAQEAAPYVGTGAMNSAMTRIVATPLIYTSGKVRLSGQLRCADGDRNIIIDLTLPGGWTAVTYQADLPDAGPSVQHVINWTNAWNWTIMNP